MDAEHWLASERRLIERDKWTAPRLRAEVVRSRSKTLGNFATDWLETRKFKLRTKIGYESMLENHIKLKIGNVPLPALNAETLRRWYSGLGSEHTTRNAHVYGLLHAVCATAVTDGLLTSNPANLEGHESTSENAPRKFSRLRISPRSPNQFGQNA
jgi:hypothetical protein